jgi:hypothetical protein
MTVNDSNQERKLACANMWPPHFSPNSCFFSETWTRKNSSPMPRSQEIDQAGEVVAIRKGKMFTGFAWTKSATFRHFRDKLEMAEPAKLKTDVHSVPRTPLGVRFLCARRTRGGSLSLAHPWLKFRARLGRANAAKR